MWIALIIIGLIIFGTIRGTILSRGTFQVVNKDGTRMYTGNFNECTNYAKSQNNFCKSFGTNDRFRVIRYKI